MGASVKPKKIGKLGWQTLANPKKPWKTQEKRWQTLSNPSKSSQTQHQERKVCLKLWHVCPTYGQIQYRALHLLGRDIVRGLMRNTLKNTMLICLHVFSKWLTSATLGDSTRICVHVENGNKSISQALE